MGRTGTSRVTGGGRGWRRTQPAQRPLCWASVPSWVVAEIDMRRLIQAATDRNDAITFPEATQRRPNGVTRQEWERRQLEVQTVVDTARSILQQRRVPFGADIVRPGLTRGRVIDVGWLIVRRDGLFIEQPALLRVVHLEPFGVVLGHEDLYWTRVPLEDARRVPVEGRLKLDSSAGRYEGRLKRHSWGVDIQVSPTQLLDMIPEGIACYFAKYNIAWE